GHLGVSPAGDETGADASGGDAGDSQPADPGAGTAPGARPGLGAGWPADSTAPGSTRPGARSPFWPEPGELFSRPDRRAARHYAAGAGDGGWLTGKAAEAYACDAKIAPMVCGHLNRNHLATAITAFLAGDLANLVISTDPMPEPGPRCECDEHPAPRRAPIPGALLSTGALPGLPATASPGAAAATGPVPPGLTPGPALPAATLTPGSLARLQDTLLRYAVSLLSGPAGLASYLRTQLTSGFFPAPSLPLDLGEPTEQVPPHLRRAVIKRDRHCSFPGCAAPPVRCHVHHVIPRSKGGPTRLDNLTLLCHFHHLIAVHRWGWTLTLHGDGTTTATSPDGIRTLHSHGPPPGQSTLWTDPPAQGPPATTAA
ncbi:MAG TPA: HNH endonuclease signature motif containing protein, partial [Streptosporangiaceae bacterium]|nr:HNH endonuclease signature motif containing protein [Streptosporangiaceae bacterium]